jgi:hypothetical protein
VTELDDDIARTSISDFSVNFCGIAKVSSTCIPVVKDLTSFDWNTSPNGLTVKINLHTAGVFEVVPFYTSY